MIPRDKLLQDFLARAGWGDAARGKLAGDASFRRYDRLQRGGERAVLMDAPPPMEDVRPFVNIARTLQGLGLSAPRIFAEDVEHGFLLLEDFGDSTYTRLLQAGEDETPLYALAVDALIALHRRFDAGGAPTIPLYDETRLLNEAALLVDWYLPALLGRPTDPARREEYLDLWRAVLPKAAGAPTTLVLRDYHVDNLMRLPGHDGVAACGLLDFQDAVIGAASYDLVSLLEDARRDVPAPLAAGMLDRYFAAFPALDRPSFMASYAVLGAQRNCKIIGIFTRLSVRDGKPHYLQHIPRVWRLLEGDVGHPALAEVKAWLERAVPPALRRAPPARPAA